MPRGFYDEYMERVRRELGDSPRRDSYEIEQREKHDNRFRNTPRSNISGENPPITIRRPAG